MMSVIEVKSMDSSFQLFFTFCYPTITILNNFHVYKNIFHNIERQSLETSIKMHNCYFSYQTYLIYKSNCSGFEICLHSSWDSARKMKCDQWEAYVEWVGVFFAERKLWEVGFVARNACNLLNNSQISFMIYLC